MNELELLDYLSKCSIEYGILDSNGERLVKATIYNTDNTTTVTKLKIKDIMYYTEYGTLTIPGKRIFQKTSLYIKRLMKEEYKKLVTDIFTKNISKTYITNQLNQLCLKVKNYIRNYMITFIAKANRLGSIIHEDEDENKYIYDMIDLSKYIECRLKIQN